MFKNLMVYRIGQDWQSTVAQIEASLQKAAFVECGATQAQSLGWAPPRGDAYGALIEDIGGQWLVITVKPALLVE